MNARQRRTVKRKVKKHGLFWQKLMTKRELRHTRALWRRARRTTLTDARTSLIDFFRACRVNDRAVVVTVSVKDGKIVNFIPSR